MTSYESIYNLALNLVDDPLLAQFPEEDLENELHSWMLQAIAKLPKLRSELSDRDDEAKAFNNELSDVAKMALAMAMKREWLGRQISSISLTLQRSSKKESYSQTEHLKGLVALDDSINTQILKLLRDDTYIDSEYFD